VKEVEDVFLLFDMKNGHLGFLSCLTEFTAWRMEINMRHLTISLLVQYTTGLHLLIGILSIKRCE
jgi:hypothetical protein